MASVIVGADAGANEGVRAVVVVSTSPGAAGQEPGLVVSQLHPRPVLAVGCDGDPITRPERVRELYEGASEPKRVVILACEAHGNDILGTEAASALMDLVLGWLNDYVK
jgi:hypothetical protein